jgi:cytochrome c551/c552
MFTSSQRTAKLIAVACFLAIVAFAACSQRSEQAKVNAPADAKPVKTSRTLDDRNVAGKSPQEVADYVFTSYDCNSCHTLGSDGKFGYTARGEQIRGNSEGCVAMLTSMSVIAQVDETNRTQEQKVKAAHFNEYGCTMCHQVTPGHLGMTETGGKLASLHMSCSEVERILNQRGKAQAN